MKTAWAVSCAAVFAVALGALVLRADSAQPVAAPAPALIQAVEPAGHGAENVATLERIERRVTTLQQRYEARR